MRIKNSKRQPRGPRNVKVAQRPKLGIKKEDYKAIEVWAFKHAHHQLGKKLSFSFQHTSRSGYHPHETPHLGSTP